MKQNQYHDFCSLIKNSTEKFQSEIEADWKELLNFSKSAGLSVLIYYAIKKLQNVPAEYRDLLRKEALQNIMRAEQQKYVYSALFRLFEEHSIDYCPLKGLAVQNIYPVPEMRCLGDLDILIREEQYERIIPLMQLLGIRSSDISDYDRKWEAPGQIEIELHTKLVSNVNEDLYPVFGDGWSRAVLIEGHRYALSNEDEFSYLVAHYAKHFRLGGIGLRHLIDLWMYKRAYPNMDWTKIRRLMVRAQLEEFYDNLMRALDVLFEDAVGNEATDIIIREAFESGSFGNIDSVIQSAAVRQHQKGGKLKYLIETAFPSLEVMSENKEILRKLPFILPFYWVRRWIWVLVQKPQGVKNVLTIAEKMGNGDAQHRIEILKKVGIKNFRGKL